MAFVGKPAAPEAALAESLQQLLTMNLTHCIHQDANHFHRFERVTEDQSWNKLITILIWYLKTF